MPKILVGHGPIFEGSEGDSRYIYYICICIYVDIHMLHIYLFHVLPSKKTDPHEDDRPSKEIRDKPVVGRLALCGKQAGIAIPSQQETGKLHHLFGTRRTM